jgi:hypothetical protein
LGNSKIAGKFMSQWLGQANLQLLVRPISASSQSHPPTRVIPGAEENHRQGIPENRPQIVANLQLLPIPVGLSRTLLQAMSTPETGDDFGIHLSLIMSFSNSPKASVASKKTLNLPFFYSSVGCWVICVEALFYYVF